MIVALYSPTGPYDCDVPGELRQHQHSSTSFLRVPGHSERDRLRRRPVCDAASGSSPISWPSSASPFPTIINAVQKQNTVNPAGQIGGEPAPAGQEFTYTVRAQGRLVSPEEFGPIVLRANPDGSIVRLKDVARD